MGKRTGKKRTTRERFEAWARRNDYNTYCYTGSSVYFNGNTTDMYSAYRAGLRAGRKGEK